MSPLSWISWNVTWSPPSRGAWIEIELTANANTVASSRPPRGGRGLKLGRYLVAHTQYLVAPLAGGVD